MCEKLADLQSLAEGNGCLESFHFTYTSPISETPPSIQTESRHKRTYSPPWLSQHQGKSRPVHLSSR